MRYRELGRTGWTVSEIGFGAWAIGAEWGTVNDQESLAALHRALFFAEAERRKVGVLVRLPLSSGLLIGKFDQDSQFEAKDHRAFNWEGEWFDRGETFSGLDCDLGLELVEELRAFIPEGLSLTQMALRWILMFPAAADLPPLSEESMAAVDALYERRVRPHVHHYWWVCRYSRWAAHLGRPASSLR